MALRHIILTVLHEQDAATGYQIVKAFDDMWQFIWKASHQQVYRELGALLEDGLVSCRSVRQSTKPDKKVYRLTRKGVDALADWQRSSFEPGRAHDELLIRIAGWKLTGADTLRHTMAQQVTLHRQRLDQYLAIEKTLLAKNRRPGMEDRIAMLPLRKGILVEQAWLKWADEVLAILP